jgi:cytochrome c-type biogenesis protein CcmH
MSALALVLALLGVQPVPANLREQEARKIETLLIAPCCWTAPVSDHPSPASDQVKREIRIMLAAGRTRQQVLDAFAAQYGTRILADPPNPVLHAGPWVAMVVTAGLIFLLLRHLVARRPATATAAGSEVDNATAADAERLDDELRAMD